MHGSHPRPKLAAVNIGRCECETPHRLLRPRLNAALTSRVALGRPVVVIWRWLRLNMRSTETSSSGGEIRVRRSRSAKPTGIASTVAYASSLRRSIQRQATSLASRKLTPPHFLTPWQLTATFVLIENAHLSGSSLTPCTLPTSSGRVQTFRCYSFLG